MPFHGGQALLVMAVEAAFANENPVAGDEFNFGRVRMRIDASLPGTYKVTYPFGEETSKSSSPAPRRSTRPSTPGRSRPTPAARSAARSDRSWSRPALLPAMSATGRPRPPWSDRRSSIRCARSRRTSSGSNGWAGIGRDEPVHRFGQALFGKIVTRLEKRRVSYNSGRLEVLASSLPNATVTATYDGVKKTLTGDGRGYYSFRTGPNPRPSRSRPRRQPPNLPTSRRTWWIFVTISQADWNPTTKELTVAAKSSMFQDGSSPTRPWSFSRSASPSPTPERRW